MKTPKQKGNNFETKIARILSKWSYGDENVLVRNANSGSMAKFRQHNVPGGDVIQVKPEYPEFPFSVECKHHKGFDIEKLLFESSKSKEVKAWAQCLNDAVKVNKIPLMVFRKNYGDIFVCIQKVLIGTMPQDDYIAFKSKARYCKNRTIAVLPLNDFIEFFKVKL